MKKIVEEEEGDLGRRLFAKKVIWEEGVTIVLIGITSERKGVFRLLGLA